MDKRTRSSDNGLYHSPDKEDLINHCLYDIAYDKFWFKDLKTTVPEAVIDTKFSLQFEMCLRPKHNCISMPGS